jgi:hypothetical protein
LQGFLLICFCWQNGIVDAQISLRENVERIGTGRNDDVFQVSPEGDTAKFKSRRKATRQNTGAPSPFSP